MQIDDALADRESEPEPSILARYRPAALFERVENLRHDFLLDTDAGVPDLNDDLLGLGVTCGDFDPPAFRRELRGILHQVPKHLLEPRGIRPAMMLARIEVAGYLGVFLRLFSAGKDERRLAFSA